MSDASDPWDIPFSRTSFMDRLLSKHENVADLKRSHDIIFTFTRVQQNDQIRMLSGDEYAFSLALVYRALDDFGKLDIISVGGIWNG